MLRISLQKSGWTSQSLSLWYGFRLLAWFPDAHCALHASHIGQLPLGKSCAELRIVAVAGVRQHDACGHTSLLRSFDLVQCDLRLGLEVDFFGHTCLLPTRFVAGPHFGKI